MVRQIFDGQFQVALHHGELVVEMVGDGAGHAPQALRLVHQPEAFFHLTLCLRGLVGFGAIDNEPFQNGLALPCHFS